MIYVLAALTLEPGHAQAFREAVPGMIAEVRREAGCIAYDCHVSITSPLDVVFVESWEDRAALQAHFEAPHMKAWAETSKDFFSARKIEIIHPEKVEVR